jgi:hypothetical protein
MIRKMVAFGVLIALALSVSPCFGLSDGNDEYLKINPINIIVYDDLFIPHYIKCDVLPIIEQGRTLVPLRNIAESLMFSVEWEETTQRIDLYKGSKKIELKMGEAYAKVNGQHVDLDAIPKIVDGRTLVPLRFISESMNKNIEWYEEPDGNAYIWLSDSKLLSDADCIADDNYLLTSRDGGYESFILIEGKQTARGIHIGDTEENVIKAYGNPHITRNTETENHLIYSSKSYPATDDGKAIIFTIVDGIVIKAILSIG